TADGLGNAKFSVDVGTVAGAFSDALNGGVAPFLRFLAGAVPPAPGNIGTSLAPQTVTGSPCGTNFFSLNGPRLPVGGLQTHQLDTIMGRLNELCGNGILEPGEQCDDGNALAGDCCSPTCTFEPLGSPCTGTGAVCTSSACNGAGACVASVTPGAACS